MTDLRLDHLYRETQHWDASVAFWQRLGFSFVDQWGDEQHRAGTLRNAEAVVVLTEVTHDKDPEQSTFMTTLDLERVSDQMHVAITATHWGTEMVSIIDPDGRRYNIESGESR